MKFGPRHLLGCVGMNTWPRHLGSIACMRLGPGHLLGIGLLATAFWQRPVSGAVELP